MKWKDVRVPPSLTWLAVFVPALAYVLSTRLRRVAARGGAVGEPWSPARLIPVISNEEDPASLLRACEALEKMFDVQAPPSSNWCTAGGSGVPVNVREVLGTSGLRDVVASVWKHDSDLGRGYLLLSDSFANGRVWRWEVGGGPITIGRTLHLEQSGCRSNSHHRCHSSNISHHNQTAQKAARLGSGGLTIDFSGNDHSAEGKLIVAEWGEGRIVRMERSGARTPLVLQVPDLCGDDSHNATKRVHRPTQLLFTPKGDLLFVDHTNSCGVSKSSLLKLPMAHHVDSLDSLSKSREAHSWKVLDRTPERVPLGPTVESVGGIAVAHEWSSIYLVARDAKGQILLMRRKLYEENDVEEVDEPESSSKAPAQEILINLTTFLAGDETPGGLAVSKKFIFVLIPYGILVIDPVNNSVLGRLDLGTFLTSLTLGGDGYLYMTSTTNLFRTRIHSELLKLPTKRLPKRPARPR